MMTPDLAKRISDDFCGQTLAGCLVEKYHRHGGTSVVLLGRDGDKPVAVKIYAKELFEGPNGQQAQAELERINRQVAMRDRSHPNLVRTRRAGRCEQTGYYYLVMDFIPHPSLDEVINDVPRDKIRQVLMQTAQAALFLHETLGHVHRDIKPGNVAVCLSDFHVTLLDLGLVRPICGETATDQGAQRIVATKRYAPPELLDGTITPKPDAWLAVTFYQLGGILYGLIMRRPLFDGLEDEALRMAVRTEIPHIEAQDVPPDLLKLARDCLQKDANIRRSLVSWERFLTAPDESAIAEEIDRLRGAIERLSPPLPGRLTFPKGAREQHALEKTIQMVNDAVEYHLRTYLNSDDKLFPRPILEKHPISATSVLYRIELGFSQRQSDLVVTIFMSCDLLDVASQVCKCTLDVYIGKMDAPPPQSAPTPFYHGSFVARTFAASLETKLPGALATVLLSQGTQ